MLKCLVGEDVRELHRTYSETPEGSLFLHSFYNVNITILQLEHCEMAKEALFAAFPFYPHIMAVRDSSVAFQMINDDVNETVKQVGVGGRIDA